LDLQKNKSLVSYIHFSMALNTYNICFFFSPTIYKFVFLFLFPVTLFPFVCEENMAILLIDKHYNTVNYIVFIFLVVRKLGEKI